MCDTVKIERPLFCRRHEDRGGRTRQDAGGNPLKVKTRAADSVETLEFSFLNATSPPAGPVVGPD